MRGNVSDGGWISQAPKRQGAWGVRPGAAPLLLLALPVLLLRPRARPVAAVCLLQLGFYLWVYLTGPVETHFYVISTLSRLLLHVLPATAIVLVLALDEGIRRPVATEAR